MDFSDLPTLFGEIWAAAAVGSYITSPVPVPSQIGIRNGAASFTDGFPPDCFIPIASGGAGPFGADFNGVLNEVTAAIQWVQAGGLAVYNAALQTAVGGYPNGAIVGSLAVPGKLWQSLVDDNLTNPDTGGANWKTFPSPPQPIGGAPLVFVTPGAYSWTVPAGASICVAEATGGGGGGGGATASNGGASGGGGGGHIPPSTLVFAVTPGLAVTGVVGAGGTAGTGAVNGGPGGNTTVVYNSVTYTAQGGLGGITASAGVTNSVSGGGVTGPAAGSVGQPSWGGVQGYSAGLYYYGGAGGASPNGGYGGQSGPAAPNPGGLPGGGGGGAAANLSAIVLGGAGGSGQVTLSFY